MGLTIPSLCVGQLGLTRKLDYLFIDEAGQTSPADALALGPCAETLVLLGDPNQLAQVTQGTHPDEAGRSVLEHLLGERATVAEDMGVFLSESWRLPTSWPVRAQTAEERLQIFRRRFRVSGIVRWERGGSKRSR
jgi:hypothetical protein